MAKRFTEVSKWEDPWFSKLSKTDKLFWLLILDKCNNAGIWEPNWPLVEFLIGGKPNTDSFKGRIKSLKNGKLFVIKFIEYQYGQLSARSNAHKSVIRNLEREGIEKSIFKGSGTPK